MFGMMFTAAHLANSPPWAVPGTGRLWIPYLGAASITIPATSRFREPGSTMPSTSTSTVPLSMLLYLLIVASWYIASAQRSSVHQQSPSLTDITNTEWWAGSCDESSRSECRSQCPLSSQVQQGKKSAFFPTLLLQFGQTDSEQQINHETACSDKELNLHWHGTTLKRYTRAACMLQNFLQLAEKKCGCIPPSSLSNAFLYRHNKQLGENWIGREELENLLTLPSLLFSKCIGDEYVVE